MKNFMRFMESFTSPLLLVIGVFAITLILVKMKFVVPTQGVVWVATLFLVSVVLPELLAGLLTSKQRNTNNLVAQRGREVLSYLISAVASWAVLYFYLRGIPLWYKTMLYVCIICLVIISLMRIVSNVSSSAALGVLLGIVVYQSLAVSFSNISVAIGGIFLLVGIVGTLQLKYSERQLWHIFLPFTLLASVSFAMLYILLLGW